MSLRRNWRLNTQRRVASLYWLKFAFARTEQSLAAINFRSPAFLRELEKRASNLIKQELDKVNLARNERPLLLRSVGRSLNDRRLIGWPKEKFSDKNKKKAAKQNINSAAQVRVCSLTACVLNCQSDKRSASQMIEPSNGLKRKRAENCQLLKLAAAATMT